jgi:hypothetical protein
MVLLVNWSVLKKRVTELSRVSPLMVDEESVVAVKSSVVEDGVEGPTSSLRNTRAAEEIRWE